MRPANEACGTCVKTPIFMPNCVRTVQMSIKNRSKLDDDPVINDMRLPLKRSTVHLPNALSGNEYA